MVSLSKLINPMAFMTREFLLVNINESDIGIISQLAEFIEEWRYCKHLTSKMKCYAIKDQVRQLNKTQSSSKFLSHKQVGIEALTALIES